MTNKPTVIIRACDTYEVQRIERLIYEGLETLDLAPHGRTLLKPNVVASGDRFPHAYTRPEFVEGVLRALKARIPNGPGVEELAVGERCGITIPTRFAYQGAGYYEMFDRVDDLKVYHFEEVPQVEIPLYHEERLRDSIYTPEPVAKADFFINCPKFKAHPWTTVTFSLKNYIGIQDDPHRLIDHDHKLNEKVADLQYIIQPQFIAIDAITAGEGRMLTPIPFDLGLVIMGNNQVAFDAVCCHIIGLDPLTVPHIRMAYERGFGPVGIDQIEIVGDVTLAQAQAKADGFRVGLVRVEEYFEGTNINAVSGPPPQDAKPGEDNEEYCWGGCPGALEEAIEILRLFDDKTDSKMPKTHIVFGNYEGELDVKPGEKVVFIGDCAQYSGKIAGKDVTVESLYVDRSDKSIHEAKSDNIFKKMAGVQWNWFKTRNDSVIRIAGCPVSVAEQVLLLVQVGQLKNPYFDPSQAIPFNNCYFSSRVRMAIKRILGENYQMPGPVKRGDSRPKQNLPPANSHAPLEHKG